MPPRGDSSSRRASPWARALLTWACADRRDGGCCDAELRTGTGRWRYQRVNATPRRPWREPVKAAAPALASATPRPARGIPVRSAAMAVSTSESKRSNAAWLARECRLGPALSLSPRVFVTGLRIQVTGICAGPDVPMTSRGRDSGAVLTRGWVMNSSCPRRRCKSTILELNC
jgi:hypothetical protein